MRELDASELVAMAETGAFLDDIPKCRGVVRRVLRDVRGICILASTHLPFLLDMMKSVRPDIAYLDPAEITARRAVRMVGREGGGALEVYTSGGHDIEPLLRKLGVSEPVRRLNVLG